MYQIQKLKNGLTLITINLPHINSVTTLVAVGAGSRYEIAKNNGISHFLEHMFFKGSRKYKTAEEIATIIDSIGAVDNASTSKEYTYYWIKSSADNIKLASDILSSMLKEPILSEEEIEREKGVIIEELRMYRDYPARYVFDLYEQLQFGDQPLGWDIGGSDKTVNSFIRDDFVKYINSLYAPENMALVYAGKLPENIKELAENYFSDLPKRGEKSFQPFKMEKQNKPNVNILYKKTDQANIVLGTLAYDRQDSRRYAARLLSMILGEGMSSRLFLQVRERRGLAYSIGADFEPYSDTGIFSIYAGLKLENVEEGLQVILAELQLIASEKVTEDELNKAKQMTRGRMALRSESTNFLAEYFGVYYVTDKKLETFEEYLQKIDAVTIDDIQSVAADLFKSQNYNLQMIAPLKNLEEFEKILIS